MTQPPDVEPVRIRVGQAAEMLGVSVETLRRWEPRAASASSGLTGGQRVVEVGEVTRLLAERRRATTDRPIIAQSARNRFAGDRDPDREGPGRGRRRGPGRAPSPRSLMTAEAVDDIGLEVGHEAVCVVKATNVIVEIPSARESRSSTPALARSSPPSRS